MGNASQWVDLVPRAFSSFKMADRRNPRPRLLKYSKNRRVFCFQPLAALFVFLQSKTVFQTKRRHFIVFTWQKPSEFLEAFWQPWTGVPPICHFEWGEGPRDDVGNAFDAKFYFTSGFAKKKTSLIFNFPRPLLPLKILLWKTATIPLMTQN